MLIELISVADGANVTPTKRCNSPRSHHDDPPRDTDNTKALDAFIAAKTEIDAMLERLAALSADHFETTPTRSTGAMSAPSNHYRAKLREITDSAFSEGEHAE